MAKSGVREWVIQPQGGHLTGTLVNYRCTKTCNESAASIKVPQPLVAIFMVYLVDI